MSSAETLFQSLLNNLGPMFVASGFKRRSQNFISESEDCWAVVNFQSRYSPIAEKSFTVNLGLASKRILNFRNEPTKTPPPHYSCHWNQRIGVLMPTHQDKWWTLSNDTSLNPIENEVRKAISDFAIPLLQNHLSEQGLLALWSDMSSKLFEYPMLKDQSILLALDKKIDILPAILERIRAICRGTLAEQGAEEHITTIKKHLELI